MGKGKKAISKAAALLGRLGALATNAKLSEGQRRANAQKAIRIRWQRYRERKERLKL